MSEVHIPARIDIPPKGCAGVDTRKCSSCPTRYRRIGSNDDYVSAVIIDPSDPEGRGFFSKAIIEDRFHNVVSGINAIPDGCRARLVAPLTASHVVRTIQL